MHNLITATDLSLQTEKNTLLFCPHETPYDIQRDSDRQLYKLMAKSVPMPPLLRPVTSRTES